MGNSVKDLIDSFLQHPNATHPVDALAELGKLSEITQASLEPEKPKVSASTQSTAAVNSVTSPTTARSSTSATATPKADSKIDPKNVSVSARYQGKNLQDSSVLQALMEFHQSRAPVRGAKSPTKIPAQASATSANTQTQKKSGFAPADIPVVEAQPKNHSTVKRSTLPTHSILKKK